MAINNVNEFLRKTFSETIFGTPALRPLFTVYGYVPVETVNAVLAKHGGIVNA